MSVVRIAGGGRRGPVRVAVVGAGETGAALADAVVASPAAELTAVCDRSLAALTRVAPFHPGTRLERDYSQVVEDPSIEAVIIAAPLRSRFRLALSALAAGKHVLILGSPATEAGEAVQLAELAAHVGVTLVAAHPSLYTATAQGVRALLDAGRLGDIRFVSASHSGAGTVVELAAQEIAMLMDWFGETPVASAATTRMGDDPPEPELLLVTLRFPSGRVASIEVSRLAPVRGRRTTVVGTHAAVVVDDRAAQRLHVLEPGGEVVAPSLGASDPLGALLADFLTALDTGGAPRASFPLAHEVALLLDEVERIVRSA